MPSRKIRTDHTGGDGTPPLRSLSKSVRGCRGRRLRRPVGNLHGSSGSLRPRRLCLLGHLPPGGRLAGSVRRCRGGHLPPVYFAQPHNGIVGGGAYDVPFAGNLHGSSDSLRPRRLCLLGHLPPGGRLAGSVRGCRGELCSPVYFAQPHSGTVFGRSRAPAPTESIKVGAWL